MRPNGVAPLAFIHVPKTAGTAFTRALMAGWPRARVVATQAEFDAIGAAEMAGLDLIAGHFYARRLEARHPHRFAAVTVLRDPFERLLSAWRFGRQHARAGAPVGPAMQAAGEMGFAAWCQGPWAEAQRHSQLYQLGLNRGDAAQTVGLPTLLAQAKARLARMEVGVVEALETFAAHVFRRHGLPPPPAVPRAMVTARGEAEEEAALTAAERAALEEALRPDALLHAHARDLMRRRLDDAARAAAA